MSDALARCKGKFLCCPWVFLSLVIDLVLVDVIGPVESVAEYSCQLSMIEIKHTCIMISS